MENNTNNKSKGFLNSIVYSVIGLIACLAFVKYVSPLGIYIISALLIIGYLYTNRRENSNYYSFLVAYIIVFAISMYCLTADTTNSRKDAYNSGYHNGYLEGSEETELTLNEDYEEKIYNAYDKGYKDGYHDCLDGIEFAD
jgi:hypothetical protein